MKDQKELDDLIMAATQADNDAAVSNLLKEIQTTDTALLKEAASNFDFLFDAWDESIYKDDNKAAVCLFLAENSILDSSTFRIALHTAIRKFLPPYISSPGIAKAVGARDSAVSVYEVALRIRKLQHIKTNAYVFMSESKTWGRVINIDKVFASIAVSTFATGGQISIPVSVALANCYFFEPNAEMTNIISASKATLKNAAFYKDKIRHNYLGDLQEAKAKELIQKMFVPMFFSNEEFATWWDAAPAAGTTAVKQRTFRESRSMLELQTKLKETAPADLTLTLEQAGKLARLFTFVRPNMPPKELEMLASCMAELAFAGSDEVLHTMFDSLRGKVPFFPQTVTDTIPLKELEIWGRVSAKLFPGFLKVARLLYDRLEIAKLAMILPLRCINVIFEQLPQDDITDALFTSEHLHSDVLVSIWKNKSKYGKDVQGILTMANISHALSEEQLPKEWTAAQRELKRDLFEKADFQKYVLAIAGNNIPSVVSSIMRMRNMAPGECQSLLVKLSRHSEALKEHIESGEGKKILAAQGVASKQQAALMTSMLSYKKLVAELDHLIKVLIPENNKAIEHARSFGDFSENAEYDAAKERRSFLRGRRSELETLVATVQPLTFTEFKADTGKVSMGTTVTLETAGSSKIYSIVGAWDGNPDRNLVSYKTKFGEALLGAQKGAQVKLPDGSTATIKDIAPLSAELAKELSSEE